jgi:hypothetical protein
MPIRMKTWRDNYCWLTDPAGVPYSPVYELGAIEKPVYYAQCSLCGCIHELQHNQPPRGLWKPRCLLIEFAYDGGSQKMQWQAVLETWHKKFPQAVNLAYKQVHLIPVSELPRAMPKKAKVEQESKAA